MATTPLTLSVNKPRFGRPERTEIRAHFARDVLADMKTAYFADDRPWIVGFSGGKDSTALVQLLYYMLARLAADQRRKHVYILASDTRVEAPYIPALDTPRTFAHVMFSNPTRRLTSGRTPRRRGHLCRD